MEAYPAAPLNYFKKTGILYTILPYYGKFDTWGKLLIPIWKASQQIWNEKYEVLRNLSAQTKWRDPDWVVLGKLYNSIFQKDIVFDSEFRLHLDCYEESDYEYLTEASMYKCPDYRELAIENVFYEPDSENILNKFLTHSTPKQILEFSFAANQYSEKDISEFSEGLRSILPAITHSVEIWDFQINQAMLTNIIECSYNVEELRLFDCEIELNDTFELNPDLDYKIKVIYLDGSCKKHEDVFLDSRKLPIFAQAISRTSLKKSLKKVRVLNHHYLQEEVQTIFAEVGMEIEAKEVVIGW